MKWTALLLYVFILPGVLAAIDPQVFSNEQQRAQFELLTQELRCPKCQNQNIADSDAPIAQDLRNEILVLLKEGKTNPQIIDYLAARYGDFVRYNPAHTPKTWLLWYGPFVALSIGFVLLITLVVRQRRRHASAAYELTGAEQSQLKAVLDHHSPKQRHD